MKEEVKHEEKEVISEETIVVEALPQVQIRVVPSEDKKNYNCVTRDEALTEILIKIREMYKKL